MMKFRIKTASEAQGRQGIARRQNTRIPRQQVKHREGRGWTEDGPVASMRSGLSSGLMEHVGIEFTSKPASNAQGSKTQLKTDPSIQ